MWTNQHRCTSSLRGSPLKFVDQQRGSLISSSLVSYGVLNFDFIKNGAIVQLDQEGVPNRTFGGIMIFNSKALIFNAKDLGSQSIDPRIRGSCIGTE